MEACEGKEQPLRCCASRPVIKVSGSMCLNCSALHTRPTYVAVLQEARRAASCLGPAWRRAWGASRVTAGGREARGEVCRWGGWISIDNFRCCNGCKSLRTIRLVKQGGLPCLRPENPVFVTSGGAEAATAQRQGQERHGLGVVGVGLAASGICTVCSTGAMTSSNPAGNPPCHAPLPVHQGDRRTAAPETLQAWAGGWLCGVGWGQEVRRGDDANCCNA